MTKQVKKPAEAYEEQQNIHHTGFLSCCHKISMLALSEGARFTNKPWNENQRWKEGAPSWRSGSEKASYEDFVSLIIIIER